MNETLKILHLEDVHSDADLIEWQLRKSGLPCEIQWVNNKHDLERSLTEFDPHLVISDHSLPDISSVEALKIVRSKPVRIPFILVTSTVSEEFAVNMMKEGVDDYILKDRLQRLPAAIVNVMAKRKAEEEEQKQIEKLISQEKKFRALFENALEGIELLDRDLRLIYRSPSASRIIGENPGSETGKSIFDYHLAEDLKWLSMIVELSRTQPGKPFNNVSQISTIAGEQIWLEVTINNMIDDPDVNALVLNYRDVTGRKQAELLQIKTTQHFRALIENISDAIILVDEQGKILYSSTSVGRTSGYDLPPEGDMNIFELFAEKDQPAARAFFASVLSQPDKTIESAFRLKHRKGHQIWVEGTIRNLLHDPSVRGCIINYRDVTERMLSDEQMRKSEANLQTIFRNTNISYTLLDRDFKVVSYNPLAHQKYLETMKFAMKEGENILDYLSGEYRKTMLEKFRQVLKGENVQYETSFEVREGERDWYKVGIFPVFDPARKVLGLVISSEDISQRKNSELEKEQMTTELLGHIKNLEQFAFIVSHNLRAPVANIMGLADLIANKDTLSTEEFEKCVQGLASSARRLDEVIIDLNDILRRRQLNGGTEKIVLKDMLTEVMAHLTEEGVSEPLQLNTDLRVASVLSVKSYLHSIFYNLISNAVKYCKPGQAPEIFVSAETEGDSFRLVVKDRGIGMDLKKVGGKIFGLYNKFHPGYEGRGMGLYMVKMQAELLGGKIEVHSEAGTGTEFRISLPVIEKL